MRLILLLALILPTSALAQARADSERYQNNHLSHPAPAKRQTPELHQWPQDEPRTEIFCDQYARAATGMRGTHQGSRTGTNLGQGLGYIGTRDRTQAEAFGMIGATLGASEGRAQDQAFYSFHFQECRAGKRLAATPK
jgi:hypothetical protein